MLSSTKVGGKYFMKGLMQREKPYVTCLEMNIILIFEQKL